MAFRPAADAGTSIGVAAAPRRLAPEPPAPQGTVQLRVLGSNLDELDTVSLVIGDGVRFSWLTFDEEYGSVPAFWFGLDRLGQRGIGKVRANFRC